jgi:O-antigen/teichoic acid export membrane protein
MRKASFRIDTILLQVFRTRAEVGIFHGVYRIILALLFIPRMITDALFPVLARYAEDTSGGLSFIFEKAVKSLLILALPLTLTVTILAEPIVVLILGAGFASAAPLLQLMSLVWAATFFSVLCNKVLNAANHQHLATVATAVCLAATVALDLLLIPRLGTLGAGLATLVGELVVFLTSLYFVVSRRLCAMPPLTVFAKPLLASLVAAVAAYALPASFPLIRGAVALCVYGLVLFFSKAIDDEERVVIRALLHRVTRPAATRQPRPPGGRPGSASSEETEKVAPRAARPNRDGVDARSRA